MRTKISCTSQNIPGTYSTSDLGTAVFLYTSGFELQKTSLVGPTRLQFHFKITPDIEAAVIAYHNGKAQASARHLFENYRALRAIAFEKTGNLRRRS